MSNQRGTTGRRSPTWVPLILLLVLAMVAAACGARLSDEQTAALQTRGQDPTSGELSLGGGTNRPAGTVGGTAGTAGTEGTEGTTSSAGGGPAGGTAGGGEATGGPGGGGPGGGPAAAAEGCGPGGGDTDVGVTADTIRVGNVSIISGPIPGFGETSRNAVQAYFNMVNSQGGVCGRQLELVAADDRFDAGVNRAEHQRLAGEAFGFVGSLSVVDGGGASVLEGTNIPDVGLSTDNARVVLPNNFSPVPNNLSDGGNGADGSTRYFVETEGISRGAVVYPAQAVARERGQAYVTDFERAGVETVVEAEVAVTETNYTGVANQIKNAGAQILLTTLEINGIAQLARALAQQGYRMAVPSYGAQVYGDQFLTLAGEAANGTKVALGFSIFEDAGQNPAVAELLTWYERTAPGSEPDFFAILGWVSADMFVTALQGAGSDLTRDKMLAGLRGLTSYDAGGLIAPINPGAKQRATCFMVAGVEGGQWVRQAPDQGFICP